jgi:opacity protein-like surface antigen
MLPRRRSSRRVPSLPLLLLVLCALLLIAAVAFSPAAAAKAVAGGGGGGAVHEGRVGKQEAEAEAEVRGDQVAMAEAGSEVVAQGNAMDNKEGSLDDMIDRTLEKEFPESEDEQGGENAWIWSPPCGIWL